MNPESHDPNAPLAWIPATGHQLRKAGVRFDAVRVDGAPGLRLAAALTALTGGDPGPVVAECAGRRSVYFLVAPGSTGHRVWPPGTTRLTAGPDRLAYIPVPALTGPTWPLVWRCPPAPDGRLVHTGLLHRTLCALHAAAERGARAVQAGTDSRPAPSKGG